MALARLMVLVAAMVPARGYAHGAMPTLVRVSWQPVESEMLQVDVGVRMAWPLLQGAVAGLESVDPGMEQVKLASEGIRRYMLASLYVRTGSERCAGRATLGALTADEQAYPTLAVQLQYLCPSAGIHVLRSEMFGHSPDHRVVVAVQTREGVAPYPLTARNPELTLDTHTASAPILRFLWDGVTHILGGWDHILFVVGLLLITALDPRKLLLAISGFTVAHTCTLVAASVGALRSDPNVVEPVIGYSIALLGLEILAVRGWGQRLIVAVVLLVLGSGALALLGYGRLPWATALGLALITWGYLHQVRVSLGRSTTNPLRYALMPFLCGLAHGLGFAGPLLDLDLPSGSFAAALVLFNAGVEVGQLFIVAIVLGCASIIRAMFHPVPDQVRRWQTGLAAGLVLAGFYWFASRAMAG